MSSVSQPGEGEDREKHISRGRPARQCQPLPHMIPQPIVSCILAPFIRRPLPRRRHRSSGVLIDVTEQFDFGVAKAGVVTHVFTHFPLQLVVYTAKVATRTGAPEGMRWMTLRDEALPNVMRKAIAHGLGE